MTRKDYVLLAQAIRTEIDYERTCNDTDAARIDGLKAAAQAICNALARDNVRFQPTRFLTACGVQS